MIMVVINLPVIKSSHARHHANYIIMTRYKMRSKDLVIITTHQLWTKIFWQEVIDIQREELDSGRS